MRLHTFPIISHNDEHGSEKIFAHLTNMYHTNAFCSWETVSNIFIAFLMAVNTTLGFYTTLDFGRKAVDLDLKNTLKYFMVKIFILPNLINIDSSTCQFTSSTQNEKCKDD